MASKLDFLSWDDDINLDDLLGEYTEHCIDDTDSEFESEQSSLKTNPNAKSASVYICPHCQKHLKTISGFRGHVTKQHNDSEAKASDYRAGAQPSFRDPTTCTCISLTADQFSMAFKKCIEKIASDPINKLNPRIGEVCESISDNSEAEAYFYNVFSKIMDVSNITISQDREKVFKLVHEFKLDSASHEVLVNILGRTCSRMSILQFVQLFSIELVGVIVETKNKVVELQSTKPTISANDEKVIYYISGYITKALKKRFMKIKNSEKREQKMKCVDMMLLTSGDDDISSKLSKWTVKMDRGGLHHPNSTSFQLVREMENVVRAHVDQENMNVHTLLKAPLKEAIMDSDRTKHYVNTLFEPITSNYANVYEDIMNIFLTVRGYATTRLVRNQLKQEKSKSLSLRGGLKAIQKP